MEPNPESSNQVSLDRSSLQVSVLAAVTLACLAVCLWLAAPFFTAIVWSLALAVAAYPVHKWIAIRATNTTLAATLTVAVIVLLILTPILLIVQQLVVEAAAESRRFQAWLDTADIESYFFNTPFAYKIYQWLKQNMNLTNDAGAFQFNIGSYFTLWLSGTIATLTQFLIMIFLLFYIYRDRTSVMQTFRDHVPLSKQETAQVLTRVGDMVYATVYGSLGVAAVQGFLGGTMFWMLGLPAPLLWGAVMMIFAIVPVVGTFVIWMPAAIALFLQGSTTKAIILLIYGATAISLVDNLLYPYLVGSKVRLHTVPVFISIAGGLIVFGLSGLVVGPAVLSLTLALLEVLRKRTEDGRSATDPVKFGLQTTP